MNKYDIMEPRPFRDKRKEKLPVIMQSSNSSKAEISRGTGRIYHTCLLDPQLTRTELVLTKHRH